MTVCRVGLNSCGVNMMSICHSGSSMRSGVLVQLAMVVVSAPYTWHNLGYCDTGAARFQWCMDHGSRHLAIANTV